ncbi:MAG: hypothetical protein LBJ86_01605, partial [Spirochaetaceae bacterium]|nr:hypothetical protein [Spirochaetaceae bacterium]
MRAALIALLAAALAFAGCNGEDSEDYVIENPLPVDSLIISPDKASVVTGSSQSFTAMSGNSKVDWTEVNWEIEGTENHDTDFDENGTLHIAENETEKTLTIVASLKSDQGKTSTAAVTIILPANSFSNAATGEINSAIDMIRAAKQSAQSSVTIALSPGPETVNLTANEDIGTTGLVLTATGDSPNSPAEVEIDGRGRTVQLAADSNNGSVITVGSGVTLTLRNITFKGKAGNNAPLVRVKDGGKLILEDGAKITGNTRTGGDQKANVDNGPEYNESTYGGGGGIVVHNGGSLEMSGTSEIS